jgi:DNA-binding CsgD family transcriptional regulator
MFAIIASSPMIPLYYTSVDIKNIEGATKLVKEYGVLHPIYTVYLITYFVAMIVTIIYSIRKKKIGKPRFAGFIAAIVGMNIAVWLFEKFVNWEYEFLSIIYVGSELLLIFVYWMIQEYVHKTEVPPPIVKEVEVIKEIEVIKERQTVVVVNSAQKAEMINRLLSVLPDGKTLTLKEIEILESLVDGKSRKEIAAENHVSENTIKTHISHVYEKFEVSSRESLMALLEK